MQAQARPRRPAGRRAPGQQWLLNRGASESPGRTIDITLESWCNIDSLGLQALYNHAIGRGSKHVVPVTGSMLGDSQWTERRLSMLLP
jgi:hypothetical protein